ncbi:MAG: hypothetical protein Q8P20_09590 [bacterium]|nr:hypothetical protein [bacterium]
MLREQLDEQSCASIDKEATIVSTSEHPNARWSDVDPRHIINKRGTIVIVRPNASGTGRKCTALAYVDTKHTYNTIQTGFEEPYHFINEGWPIEWK